jgi:hypothetical protein
MVEEYLVQVVEEALVLVQEAKVVVRKLEVHQMLAALEISMVARCRPSASWEAVEGVGALDWLHWTWHALVQAMEECRSRICLHLRLEVVL